MVNALQSLRGIFAVLIFFHHYRYTDGASISPAGGDCGVAFFLVLSGYVMSLAYHKPLTEGSFAWKTFMVKRLIRLWPLYLLCLAISLPLFGVPGINTGIANALMLQSWFPNPDIYFSGNPVSWCVGDFMLAYALFPFNFAAVLAWRRTAIAIFLILSAAYAATGAVILDPQKVQAWMYIFPPARLLDFTLGVILWYISSRIPVYRPVALQSAALLVLAAAFLLYPIAPAVLTAAIWWWPAAALLILSVSPSCGSNKGIARILQWRPLVAFGNVSFSFYMIHMLVHQACAPLETTLSWWPLLLLDMTICVVGAFVLTTYFEKPAMGLAYRILLKKDNSD